MDLKYTDNTWMDGLLKKHVELNGRASINFTGLGTDFVSALSSVPGPKLWSNVDG